MSPGPSRRIAHRAVAVGLILNWFEELKQRVPTGGR